MSSPLPERKPWSLKWVVLAIILFMAGYTFLTLHFRKPGRAYEPYADMKARANTGRLLAAGYQRIELSAERPADFASIANNTFPAPGGLPADLKATLVSMPLLALDILETRAPASVRAGDPYRIEFRCATPDNKQQLAAADLYIRGDEIVITPDFERLEPGLVVRTRDTVIALTLAPGVLKPGSYHVLLAGEHTSKSWRLQVN